MSNLDILIKIATEGGPQAQAVIEQLNQAAAEGSKEAAEALQKITAANGQRAQSEGSLAEAMAKVREQSEAAKAARAQEIEFAQDAAIHKAAESSATEKLSQATVGANKLSEAYSYTLKGETAETVKSTEAKKQQGEALRGLSRAFPEVAGTIRAMISPLGAAVAAMGYFILKIREMAAERRAVEAFNVEMGNVRANAVLMQEMAAQAEATATKVKKEFGEMRDIVAEYRRELEAAARARAAIVDTNKESDDLIEDRQIAEIEASNDTPSNKKLRIAQLREGNAKKRKQDEIDEVSRAAAKDAEAAAALRGKALQSDAGAAALEQPIKDAEEATALAKAELAAQAKYRERNLPAMDKELVDLNLRVKEFPHDKKLRARRDRLEQEKKYQDQRFAEATDIVTDAEAREKGLKDLRAGYETEAKGFRSNADTLDQSSADGRTRAQQMQDRFNVVQPQRDSLNSFRNLQAFNAEYISELQARIREATDTNAQLAKMLIDYLSRTAGDNAEIRKFIKDMLERLNRDRPGSGG